MTGHYFQCLVLVELGLSRIMGTFAGFDDFFTFFLDGTRDDDGIVVHMCSSNL